MLLFKVFRTFYCTYLFYVPNGRNLAITIRYCQVIYHREVKDIFLRICIHEDRAEYIFSKLETCMETNYFSPAESFGK